MAHEPLLIARPPRQRRRGGRGRAVLASLSQPHGLIVGASGTGKTLTLQRSVERVSRIGVPTLLAVVKGDLWAWRQPARKRRYSASGRTAGLGAGGLCRLSGGVLARARRAKPSAAGHNRPGWGRPCLVRLLNLNDTQAGVFTVAFRVADDQGLLAARSQGSAGTAAPPRRERPHYQTSYASISAASVWPIQRGLQALEQQAADRFFSKRALIVFDRLQSDGAGHDPYREAQDRESAYEWQLQRAAGAASASEASQQQAEAAKQAEALAKQEASERSSDYSGWPARPATCSAPARDGVSPGD